jgi:hypothetical protein
MIRIALAFLAISLSSAVALAAPSVPGRAALKGDVVAMNQQFHLAGYNFRIEAIRWVPANDAFVQKVASYVGDSNPPNGALVFEVPVKNTQSEVDTAPDLTITVQYKDGTQADSSIAPFGKSGGAPVTSRKIYPGQGTTLYYVVKDVPQPTAGNPLVKLIIKNNENNDPGYPAVYRLLHPVVGP